ncbi:uncharacterized protein At4g04980-like [Phoenix dactylifera]|uniref:Uncharacterized protein At4g04980-like n=1 Tax=Phoenix dactylifera TaxID=42345 RepID=A0A8B7CVU5_PHODC|nr:uncharacterized protein At4g04980-like [Phoenix dactylifera]
MRMDESFKRPGSIPFKWEIQPGIPKPHSHSNPSSPLETKLSPPPSRTPPSPSPSIFTSPLRPKLSPLPYSTPPSPFQSPTTPRSSSASPSKRRGHHILQSKIHAFSHEVAVVSQGCFPVPPIRRKDDKRSIGGGGIEMIFPSRHRSMPTRSSPSFSSPFRKSSWARDEVEVAARWLF